MGKGGEYDEESGSRRLFASLISTGLLLNLVLYEFHAPSVVHNILYVNFGNETIPCNRGRKFELLLQYYLPLLPLPTYYLYFVQLIISVMKFTGFSNNYHVTSQYINT